MKEIAKKKAANNDQTKQSERTKRKERKPQLQNARRNVNGKETESKESIRRNTLVSDSNPGKHYVDDVNRFEETPQELKEDVMISKETIGERLDDHSRDLEKQPKQQEKEEVSDSDTIRDSVSSQGDSGITEDEKGESELTDPNEMTNKSSLESSPHNSRESSDSGSSKLTTITSHGSSRESKNFGKDPSSVVTETSSQNNSRGQEALLKPLSESSEGIDESVVEELKEINFLDGSSAAQSMGSDVETPDAEENGEHDDEAALEQKVEEMEMRIEKLEEELREVAALEISLYSVVPEHGSSAHKVHTPARRLSRLYIHACKHWTQAKRATIAKNSVSGLVLISRSCGNDVPRLTFWLSNTIVLREIISQAFGSTHQLSPVTRLAESNGCVKRNEVKSMTLKWKANSGNKQVNGLMQPVEDWQETGTFVAALIKVESWLFSRIVESVWWQALTPNMQSRSDCASSNRSLGKLLGPPLGDQQQGSFSINLWRNAFQDALQRLCPVRAGGHLCGCLPVLARMVMEQCITRLDVAMFNAILRESAHEIPTDPVSDPIIDSKVLPIPAGDLSFGSGAQLKNSVGNWSRWLTDKFGMDTGDALKDQHSSDENDGQGGNGELKIFILLNSLSDLLMLPKDMLIDRSIRKEVCPLISLPLIKRILCNFTPDEFCPDAVPGAVLEALNAENIVERRLSGFSARNFPYTAAPVTYSPPSTSDVAEKVAEAGGKSHLERNASMIQRKGYTSDEELEELDSPITSIIDKLPSSPAFNANSKGRHEGHTGFAVTNARYELLRDVWSI